MTHRFLILGPPLLQRNGKSLKVDTRKASALLAYLAVQKQTFQRDRLAAFLWPDLDQSRARAALRRTLTPLNKALGKDALLSDRETVALNPDFDLWLDIRRFEACLAECEQHGHPGNQACERCLDPLRQAAELVRGDFMEGFTLRDSAAFDDWQFEQLEYFRRQHAQVLEKLANCLSARQEYEPAIDYARRWLSLDALHEPAHRALMLIYARSGDRSSALQQYRACVRVLDEELGVPPLEETNQLYNDILEGNVNQEAPTAPPIATPGAGRSPKPETPPLVGREEEWDTLLRQHRQAAAGGVFTVIEGEIGIGKTRLAEEFLDDAQRNSFNCLSARCYPGENNLAYAPFISALRPIESRDLHSLPPIWQSAASLLLPQLEPAQEEHPGPDRLPDTGAQSLLFEAVRQLLANFSRRRKPGLLFLDDLQWADSASFDLLTYLVRRLRELPLMILGTWRLGDVPAGHPLRTLLAETQRAGYGNRIHLDRLTQSEVDRLAEYFPDAPQALRGRLYRETEGLPFFIIEYLHNAASLGDDAVPTSIHEIQLARMESLNEAERQLLTTAAVIGRSADYNILREASGRSEEEAVNALDGLLAKNMLVESGARLGSVPSPVYDFTHETLYRVVYDQSSLARRRLLHRRTAEALSKQNRAQPAPNATTAQIARHLQLSGQEEEAAGYFYQAGLYARSLFANEEALGHFRTALALGHPDGAALHEAIADLLTLKGNYTQAGAGYETAAALAEPDRVPVLERKLGVLHHRRGDFDLAAHHFQAALEGFVASQKAPIYADWSRTEARRGDLGLGRELAQKGLKLAEEASDVQARGQAHNILGIIARMGGQAGEASRHLEQALEAAGDHPFARAAALNNLALVRRDEGDYETAAALAQEALALCVRLGDRHREAALRNHLADIFHAAGKEADSMRYLKQAVEIFAEIGMDAGDLEPEIWKLTEW